MHAEVSTEGSSVGSSIAKPAKVTPCSLKMDVDHFFVDYT